MFRGSILEANEEDFEDDEDENKIENPQIIGVS